MAGSRSVAPSREVIADVVSKDTDPDDILEAIREVHAGRSVISQRVTRDLISSVRDDPGIVSGAPAPPPLTSRELSIVKALAHGRSNAEIARQLHLAEPTVKAHLGRVMTKWGVRDRVQVLIYAITKQIIDIESFDLQPPR